MTNNGDGKMGRRSILNRFLLAGCAAATGIGAGIGPAWAFRVVDAPGAVDDEYRDACSSPEESYHQQLRAAAMARLSRDGIETGEIDNILTAMECPRCGCSIVG
jgi:hypothetical protein